MIRSPVQVLAYDVPGGLAGTRATVKIMTEWVQKRADSERLRTRARELFAGLPSLDDWGELHAVWDFITTNVRYMSDNLGYEHVTDPEELDRQIDEGTAAEDCESIATYAAALFAVSGRRSEFVLHEKDPSRPGQFSHCALRVEVKRPRRGWVWFDPVGYFYRPQSFQLGDTVGRAGELVETWNLDGEQTMHARYHEGTLMGATLGDTTGDQVAEGAAAAANVAGALGPWGALIGGATQAALGIAAAAGSDSAKKALGQDKKKDDKKDKNPTGAGVVDWIEKQPTAVKLGGGVLVALGIGALLARRGRRAA